MFDDDEQQRYDMAPEYQTRDKQSQPFIKIEGAASESQSTYYRAETPNEMNVSMEMPGDMNQLPHKMRMDMASGRQRSDSQGYVEPYQELFDELFGEASQIFETIEKTNGSDQV